MSKNDDAVVICCKWPEVLVPGSKKVKCAKCKTDCGVSPATLKALKDAGFKPHYLCGECLTPKDLEGANPAPITKDQFDEVLSALTGILKSRMPDGNETWH